MTKEDIRRETAAIERKFDNRIAVWRVLIRPDGTETGQRIFRGWFQQPSHHQGEST